MAYRHRLPALAAGAACLLLVLCGCSTPQSCTMIGAEDGVSVTATGFPGTGLLTVTVCRADTCGAAQIDPAQSDQGFALLPLGSNVAMRLHVTVATAQGETVLDSPSVTVTPTEVQPNGPHCAPTAHQARLRVSPTGVEQVALGSTGP